MAQVIYVKKLAVLLLINLLMPVLGCAYALEAPELHGFVEAAIGAKLRNNNTKNSCFNLLEQRIQLSTTYYPDIPVLQELYTEINFKGDLLVDEHFEGRTRFNIREANVFFSPLSWVDAKVGRQIFTWGTGDYLFINDVFPKDYVSFFVGRGDEYLKKPSDGIKVSLYNDLLNLDLIAIPYYAPNTLAKGKRLSFYNVFDGGPAGEESARSLVEPSKRLENTETALRAHRNFESYETALYFFSGFYKNPRGYKNEARREMFYPRLNVYGASVRGPVLGGIGNVETGYYQSRQDKEGTERHVPNSSLKLMAGYKKDLGHDLSIGVQYLLEHMLDYSEYKGSLMPGDAAIEDKNRHLITGSVSQLLLNQTLLISIFTFYSPSDDDVYLRPLIEYDITDRWKLSMGANLIWGRKDYTEFGQMERNSNVYTRVRYSY